MKWLLILLGLILIVAAGAGSWASIDLLTTGIGAIYATCSAVALGAGLIILALAALAHRIDALRATMMRQGEIARRAAAEHDLAPPVAAPVPANEAPSPPPDAENLPPIAAEAASMEAGDAAHPAATTLVGRYSSGGSNYSIFSDGSIEAETEDGAFRFASMSEFKAFIAARRASA